MNTTNIYILIDPETNTVRYVGKANNIKQRYKAHLNKARKHQIHKKNWIESLKKKGLKPIVDIIDIVPIHEWIFWETYWISQFKAWGFNLINYTNGGEGCTFGNQTSFKKGHKLGVGRVVSQETLNKMSLNRKGQKMSEEAKKKNSIFRKGKVPPYMKNGITEDQRKRMSKTQFKKGGIPWSVKNKGLIISKYRKPVQQFDLNGNFIADFSCCKEAAKVIKCNEQTIRNCCNNYNIKPRIFRNYKWKYK